MRMGRWVVLVMVLLSAGRASASTDINGLFDARSTGMGGAGVAFLDSAAGIPTNPALLDQIDKLAITLNAFYIRSQPEAPYTIYHVDANGQRSKTYESIRSDAASAVLPFGGVAYRLFDWMVLGLAAYPVIGQGTAATFRPAPNEIPALVATNDAAMGLVEIQEAASFKISDNLSFGAGWRITYMTQSVSTPVETKGAPAGILIDRSKNAVNANIDVTGLNFLGFQFGVLYKPIPSLRLALTYRSKVTVDGEGTTTTTNPVNGMLIVNPTRTGYTNPHSLRGGAALSVLGDSLLLAFDVKYNMYAEAFKVLDTFITMNGVEERIQRPAYWKDSVSGSFGGEYKVADALRLRLGYNFTTSATPDEYALAFMAPPGVAHLITGGLGTKLFDSLNVDFAAAYVQLVSRVEVATEYNAGVGNYASRGIELSFSATYRM
ncbi:MAG: outer membrane protein transport protein [Polyangiales bacterium]